MSVRPPRQFTATEKDPLSRALEQEVMGEKADTLARLMTRLEKALAKLAAHEERIAQEEAASTDPARRQRLVAEAGEALWHVVIQRELCGLRRHDGLMREMRVPKTVRLSMGPASLRKP